jgi:adenylosuccinate synthase
MSQEISLREISRRSGISLQELKQTEITSTTHRPRKIAEFDWVQLRQNVTLNSPTDLALTFVDYLDKRNRSAYRYEQLQPDTLRFIEEVERVSGVPVNLISVRFHSRSVIDRRTW